MCENEFGLTRKLNKHKTNVHEVGNGVMKENI